MLSLKRAELHCAVIGNWPLLVSERFQKGPTNCSSVSLVLFSFSFLFLLQTVTVGLLSALGLLDSSLLRMRDSLLAVYTTAFHKYFGKKTKQKKSSNEM